MVKFTKETRESMMKIVTKQKTKIDELEKKKTELEKELKKLLDELGGEHAQSELICELYGISYNFLERRYELDPEP